jgi:hypothetical protein
VTQFPVFLKCRVLSLAWLVMLVACAPNSGRDVPGDTVQPGQDASAGAVQGSDTGAAADAGAGAAAGAQATAGAGAAAGSGSAVCLQGSSYTASGTVPVNSPARGDANVVSGLRAETHSGCERFVIDLATDAGATASTTGPVRASVLRELGVVRISLTGVAQVDANSTQATFPGTLGRAAYAVWSNEGRWVYVDLHLGAPAEASVMTLANPARVVVDLRPGGGPVPAPPASFTRAVVLQPRAGSASYPLTITGYARTFEANVVARLMQNGTKVHESFTTATAWADAWGHYSITIPSGPGGPVTLQVGEYSAKDGEWTGATVRLDMR